MPTEAPSKPTNIDPLGLRLVQLFWVFLPLDVFSIGGLSVARLLFVPVVLVTFIRFVLQSRRAHYVSWMGLVLSVLLVSSILSGRSSGPYNSEATADILPSYLYSILVMVVSVEWLQGPADRNVYSRILKAWTVLVLALGFYDAYASYILLEQPFHHGFLKPIGDIFFQAEHELKLLRGTRVFLPTATPPRLSLFCALLTWFWLARYIDHGGVSPLLSSLLLLLLMVLTGSRSGLFAFFFSLFVTGILSVFRLPRYDKSRFRRFYTLILLYVSSLLAAAVTISSVFGSGGLARLFQLAGEASFGRHLMLRLSAVNLLAEMPVFQLPLGIGVGQYSTRVAGSYPFSIYLTSLVENGIMSALIVSGIFVVGAFRNVVARTCWPSWHFIFFAGLGTTLFIANWFYEFKAFTAMWFFVALMYSNPENRKPNV